MYKLTIAIPTFNRPAKVVARLRQLHPQCTPEVGILIVDNASDENVEEAVRSTMPEITDRIRFHRNRANVGLAANICRCFELADGEWIWTLGDDDEITSDSVSLILRGISALGADEQVGGINFSTGIHQYQHDEVLATPEDYWHLMSEARTFSNALFLSSCVFNSEMCRAHLRTAYMLAFSAAPHLAVPMAAMRDGWKMAVCASKTVEWEVPDAADAWNKFSVGAGLPVLAEIPGCSRVAWRRLENGILLHAPGLGLREGIKNIFVEDKRGPEYWYLYYSRLAPFTHGGRAVRVMFLRTLAGSACRFPAFRNLGSRILLARGVETGNADAGLERL